MTVAVAEAVPGLVAESEAMRALVPVILRLAEAKSAVLLEGESGTGKDLLAHRIHYSGPHRDGPFIKVHCPSIPEDLLESELFGHERGAFTDAGRTKLGKIEMAVGGTLYFDQIQDLSLVLQGKLLRVVEEHSFERLGGTRTIEVDVRFISSSNVDLGQAVGAGRFREDLFHRLNVVALRVPPLRERQEDILPLAELFLARERARGVATPDRFAPETMQALRGYSWPGNVRELRSVVERACLFASDDAVPLGALPAHVLEQPATLWAGRDRRLSLKDLEKAYIKYVLEDSGGNQTRAARILGISRKSLWEKRRRFGIP